MKERPIFNGSDPLFQEPPDDLGPDSNHGFLIGGMIAYNEIQVAQSYRSAGDALVASALKDADLSHEWVYPVFFVYRHALELYLKLVVRPKKLDHKLCDLIKEFENICKNEIKQELPAWVKLRLDEIIDIDPGSTSFRYSDVLDRNDKAIKGEWWVDYHHLKWLMNCLFDGLENAYYMNPRIR